MCYVLTLPLSLKSDEIIEAQIEFVNEDLEKCDNLKYNKNPTRGGVFENDILL